MKEEQLQIEPFVEKCDEQEEKKVKEIIQDIFNTIKKEHGVS